MIPFRMNPNVAPELRAATPVSFSRSFMIHSNKVDEPVEGHQEGQRSTWGEVCTLVRAAADQCKKVRVKDDYLKFIVTSGDYGKFDPGGDYANVEDALKRASYFLQRDRAANVQVLCFMRSERIYIEAVE